jgi:uncharacterized protein (DUF302 family)
VTPDYLTGLRQAHDELAEAVDSASATGERGVTVIVTKPSVGTVEETVSRLRDVIAAKGLKLFAVIDHSGEARANGLALRDTKVVVFGSPVAGTPVMQARPLAALDLPLKVLVWDDDGQTQLSYAPPAELAGRYDFDDDLAGRLAGIETVIDAALAQ